MIAYIVVGIIVFWLGYSKNTKQRYILTLIILFLFTVLRNDLLGGSDIQIYKGFFLRATSWDFVYVDDKYAVGYRLLNFIVRSLTDNFYIYIFIYSSITFFLLHLILRELNISYTEKCILLFTYLCLRFFYNEWIAYRQNLSNLLFWLFLIKLYKQNKFFSFKTLLYLTCSILLPYLFHDSALLNIPLLIVLFALRFIPKKFKQFVIPIISIVLFLQGSRLLEPLVGFMTRYVDESYSSYLGTSGLSANLIYFILRLMFYVAFCIIYEQDSTNKQYKYMFDIFSVMLMISSINLEIASRVFEYYAIGLYFAAAIFFRLFSANDRKAIVPLIYFTFMMIIMVRFLLIFDSGGLLPYRIWNL